MGSVQDKALLWDAEGQGRVSRGAAEGSCHRFCAARHVPHSHCKILPKPRPSNATLIRSGAAALPGQRYLVGSTTLPPSLAVQAARCQPWGAAAAPPCPPAAPSASHVPGTGSGVRGWCWHAARPRGGLTCGVAGGAGGRRSGRQGELAAPCPAPGLRPGLLSSPTAPRGKRGWKPFHAILKGMILYLQKVGSGGTARVRGHLGLGAARRLLTCCLAAGLLYPSPGT